MAPAWKSPAEIARRSSPASDSRLVGRATLGGWSSGAVSFESAATGLEFSVHGLQFTVYGGWSTVYGARVPLLQHVGLRQTSSAADTFESALQTLSYVWSRSRLGVRVWGVGVRGGEARQVAPPLDLGFSETPGQCG